MDHARAASLAVVALDRSSRLLFAFYVANFGSYNATYGAHRRRRSIFLVWLWMTNLAILLGAELNAELER